TVSSSVRASASAIIRASARSASTSARRSTVNRAIRALPSTCRSGRRSDMSDAPFEPPAPAPRRRGTAAFWISRVAKALVVVALGLVALGAALMAFLDTDPGHRLIVDRIAALAPESGLRIRIGRIDGSIWSRVRLRDVRLYDPRGLFAES